LVLLSFNQRLNDIEIDKITNKNRPLIKKDLSLGECGDFAQILLGLSILIATLISPVILAIVISYVLLTWIYSCPPFRLKRFFGISNVLISLASLNFLVIGFLVFSENQTLASFPWRVYWFLFLAYLLITPLKDLKDLEGDRKNKSCTLVVLLGRKKTRLLIASFLFSFYLLSVYVLNKQELFLAALLFGSINFLVISHSKVGEKNLNGWVLGLVFIYGLLVIKTVFLNHP
jgi:4-hydroxybenzoate polyprenyltransferase